MPERGRPRHPDVLTPREWEVLALLREQLSNEEIADRLGISVAGVKYHVSSILGKLGVSTRSEAAEWAPTPERRPLAVLASLPALRGGAFTRLPVLAGAGAIAATIGFVAILVWGLATVRSPADRRYVEYGATQDARAVPPGDQQPGPPELTARSAAGASTALGWGQFEWTTTRDGTAQMLIADAGHYFPEGEMLRLTAGETVRIEFPPSSPTSLLRSATLDEVDTTLREGSPRRVWAYWRKIEFAVTPEGIVFSAPSDAGVHRLLLSIGLPQGGGTYGLTLDLD